MTGTESKAVSVVDALVKATVRSVLFPGLKGGTGSPSRGGARVAKAPTIDKAVDDGRQENREDKNELPFVLGSHFAHVLSYASWSDAQLIEEKRRLHQCLTSQEKKPSQKEVNTEQDEDDRSVDISSSSCSVDTSSKCETTKLEMGELDAAVLEAYALLTLFQNERALASDHPAGCTPSSRELVHVQLDLYAKYFEKTQRRKIQQEVDVLPIQKTYQHFVESASSTSSSVTT